MGDGDRFVRSGMERAVDQIHQLAAATRGMGGKRVYIQLGKPKGIRLSTIQPDPALSSKDEEKIGRSGANNALLAEPGLVPVSLESRE